jgi:hypothetical protein
MSIPMVLTDAGRQAVLAHVIESTAQRIHDRVKPFRPSPFIMATLRHQRGYTNAEIIEIARGKPVKETQAWLDQITAIPPPTATEEAYYQGDRHNDANREFDWYLQGMIERIPKDEQKGVEP